MRTRRPDLGEPHTSVPIYARFGMTKGALLAVAVLTVGAIAGFARLETLASHERATDRQLRALIRQHEATIASTKAQARQNRNALREVCRQTSTLEGLADAGARLVAAAIASPQTPARSRPSLEHALQAFTGYGDALKERPACREVLKP